MVGSSAFQIGKVLRLFATSWIEPPTIWRRPSRMRDAGVDRGAATSQHPGAVMSQDARHARSFSQKLKTVESGHVQHYGLIMASGIVALVAFLIYAL